MSQDCLQNDVSRPKCRGAFNCEDCLSSLDSGVLSLYYLTENSSARSLGCPGLLARAGRGLSALAPARVQI
jgi:hypothetical protein